MVRQCSKPLAKKGSPAVRRADAVGVLVAVVLITAPGPAEAAQARKRDVRAAVSSLASDLQQETGFQSVEQPWNPMLFAPAPAPAARSRCEVAKTCATCTALPECGWCGLEMACVEGDKLGPKSTQCSLFSFSHCSNIPCSARATCADCVADPDCGWCAGRASCADGGSGGPADWFSCPAPEEDSRPVWLHQGSVLQCQNPPLHSVKLWDRLRDMMYASQARIGRLMAADSRPAPELVVHGATTPVPPMGAMPPTVMPNVGGGGASGAQGPVEVNVDIDQDVDHKVAVNDRPPGLDMPCSNDPSPPVPLAIVPVAPAPAASPVVVAAPAPAVPSGIEAAPPTSPLGGAGAALQGLKPPFTPPTLPPLGGGAGVGGVTPPSLPKFGR